MINLLKLQLKKSKIYPCVRQSSLGQETGSKDRTLEMKFSTVKDERITNKERKKLKNLMVLELKVWYELKDRQTDTHR